MLSCSTSLSNNCEEVVLLRDWGDIDVVVCAGEIFLLGIIPIC